MAMEALPGGTRIGGYAIERLLSDKGGFSLVYVARHPAHGTVAIKECAMVGQADRRGTMIVSRPERRADFDWTRARFRQEARFLLSNGRHPHIVRAIELIEANDTVYLAMELLEESLDQRLERTPRQVAATAAAWLDPVGQALTFCEAQNCHHLDIAPKNIMFDRHGQTRLIDFGFSRLGNASQLRSSRLATTDGYSAIEKYTFSSRDLDARSDVYSLAATLVRALGGVEPIDARVRQGQGHARFVPPEIEAGLKDIAGAAGYAVLERAMAVQRSDRFISIGAFLAAWHSAVHAPPPRRMAAPTPPIVHRTQPDDRRRVIALVSVIAVATLACLVLLWTIIITVFPA